MCALHRKEADPSTDIFAMQTGELQSALLTTFCGDPGWIHSHFSEDVKVLLVMPAGGVPTGEQIPVQQNMILFNPRKYDNLGCLL
jgi:hypothetical protein